MHIAQVIHTLQCMSTLDAQASISDAVRHRPSTISQRAMARQLGVSPQALGDRIHGRARWQIADALVIADMLGMTLDQLVCSTEADR